MRYRALGRSGLRVSVLGIGCRQWGERVEAADAERLARTGIDLGVNLFDTADSYGAGASEETLGRALRGLRDQVVVATKVRWPVGEASSPNARGASRVHIRSAVEASLRRLGTDHIDLYQIHAPDPVTPLEETLATLDDLITAGKILYAGASQLSGWEIVDAYWRASTVGCAGYISTQVQYSVLDRTAEREILPAAQRTGVGVLAILALARGYLAGAFDEQTPLPELDARRRAVMTVRNRKRRKVIDTFAAVRGLTVAEVALAAIAGRPAISSVLVGASNSRQLIANADTLAGEKLSADDIAALFAELAVLDSDRLELP